MDSSDEDTFEDSNNEEEDIDEIFEDGDDTMSLDQDNEEEEDNFMEDNWPPQNIPSALPDKSGNKKKPGIVYLSSIPPGFNVTTSIAFFSQFGKVGRVFLQPGNFLRHVIFIFDESLKVHHMMCSTRHTYLHLYSIYENIGKIR